MEIKKEIIVNKPAAEVWSVLGDQFGEAYLWAQGLYHSKSLGAPKIEGAHCSDRVCDTSFGKIKEEIRVYDADNYRLSYAVLEGFPSFVASGVNNWSLTPMGEKTKVNIHLVIQTKGLKGSIMAPMMKLQMNGVLNKVGQDFKHYVETGNPSPEKAKEMTKRAA